MNIFINIVSENSITFFDDNNFNVVKINKNEEFANIINKNTNWKEIKNIFYTNGPAYFTILRNMSVFLNTFKLFVEKVNFYGISSAEYLFIEHPKADICLIPSGKNDFYTFTKDGLYKKLASNELESIIKKYKCVGGNKDLLKNYKSKFIKPIDTEEIIQTIIKKKDNFEKNFINIDYGSLPKIG